MKKNIFVLILMLMVSISSMAQTTIVDKYRNNKEVTCISISKAMFRLMGGNKSIGGMNLSKLKGQIDGLKVITTEDKKVSAAIAKDYKDEIKKFKYEELMSVQEKDEEVMCYAKMNGETITSVMMLVTGKGKDAETVFLYITGMFKPEDLESLKNM